MVLWVICLRLGNGGGGSCRIASQRDPITLEGSATYQTFRSQVSLRGDTKIGGCCESRVVCTRSGLLRATTVTMTINVVAKHVRQWKMSWSVGEMVWKLRSFKEARNSRQLIAARNA